MPLYKSTKYPKSTKKYKKIHIGGATLSPSFKELEESSNTNNASNGSKNLANAMEYLSHNELYEIAQLFNNTFAIRPLGGKLGSLFTLKTNLKDMFLQGQIDFHKWYIERNPDFLNISELKERDGSGSPFKMPEFEILIANIAKDLLLMLKLNKYSSSNETSENINKYRHKLQENHKKTINDRNTAFTGINITNLSRSTINRKYTTKITRQQKIINRYSQIVNKSLLNNTDKLEMTNMLSKINIIISEGYIYKNVQELYLEFLQLVSIGNCEFSNSELITIYDTTPYIVFPSHYTLDFKDVVNLCSAPILNFKFMSRRQTVHSEFFDPCSQINHDIIAHSNVSHNYRDFIYKHINGDNIKSYFKYMNDVLNKMRPFYDYNENNIKKNTNNNNSKPSLITYDMASKNLQQLCICIILFYILHENIDMGNTIRKFNKNESDINKIDKFTNIHFIDIGKDDDINAPNKKYKILKKIDWKTVYSALLIKLKELNIISSEINLDIHNSNA